jgi:hypothetical protein
MRKLAILAPGMSLLVWSSVGYAADHLFTATAAGGLTTSSQPFLNGTGTTSKAPTADAVPGQGSPLSGAEHTVPSTDTQTGATLMTLPPATQDKTAPSANSTHSIP